LILVDTDVLIWVTRKDPHASAFLDSFDDLAISDVTYMELIQGAKNKREAQAIDKTLKNMEVLRLPITSSMSCPVWLTTTSTVSLMPAPPEPKMGG